MGHPKYNKKHRFLCFFRWIFVGSSFKFSILLRRPWAWAWGEWAWARARGLRRRMDFFFQTGFQAFRNPYIKDPKRKFPNYFFHNFLVVGEAALAADLITAWKSLRGGCASSRPIHGFAPKKVSGASEGSARCLK